MAITKKDTIGMVISIETSKGTAYGICTHYNEDYGSLLYFYPIGTKLSELESANTQFCCFFPLRAAIRRKAVEKVCKIEVPPKLKDFPIFRYGVPEPNPNDPDANWKVVNWWFWDGEEHWEIGKISKEQRKMPIEGLCNDTLIIERLEEGYTAENDWR